MKSNLGILILQLMQKCLFALFKLVSTAIWDYTIIWWILFSCSACSRIYLDFVIGNVLKDSSLHSNLFIFTYVLYVNELLFEYCVYNTVIYNITD